MRALTSWSCQSPVWNNTEQLKRNRSTPDAIAEVGANQDARLGPLVFHRTAPSQAGTGASYIADSCVGTHATDLELGETNSGSSKTNDSGLFAVAVEPKMQIV
jgi:hypothetical protein